MEEKLKTFSVSKWLMAKEVMSNQSYSPICLSRTGCLSCNQPRKTNTFFPLTQKKLKRKDPEKLKNSSGSFFKPWFTPSWGHHKWLTYILTTLVACGPLGPSTISKLTSWPSRKVLKPSSWIAEKWTKISLPPFSCSMKPNPLASLNHFTLPVAKPFHHLSKAKV